MSIDGLKNAGKKTCFYQGDNGCIDPPPRLPDGCYNSAGQLIACPPSSPSVVDAPIAQTADFWLVGFWFLLFAIFR